MNEAEHKQYHLEVSLTDCGVPGCDFARGMALHFQAFDEDEVEAAVFDNPTNRDAAGASHKSPPRNVNTRDHCAEVTPCRCEGFVER